MSPVTALQSPFSFEPPKTSSSTCQQCGADIPYATVSAAAEDAQRRISGLEAQVRILTGKATAAVDKLADYEDQLHQLKSTQDRTSRSPSPHIATQPPTRPSSNGSTTTASNTSKPRLPSRITNLLRPPSAPATPAHPPPSTSPPPLPTTPPPLLNEPSDLLTQLTREQAARQAAESKLTSTHQELEELSAQLFTEANEMVAQERKARAKLEKRVEVLERRDKEKRDRLAELERRIGRVERVRGLLSGYA